MNISNVTHYFLATTPILPWTFLTFGFWLIEDGVKHKWGQKIPNIFCGLAVCFTVVLSAPFIVKTMQLVTGHDGKGFIDVHPLAEYPALSLFLSVVFFIFVRDLFFYCWHRAEHKISVLWDIHAVHHSEERFNATTYMRQHWLEGFLQSFFVQMPVIIIFQFTPEVLYTAYFVTAAWDFFSHADLSLEIGRCTFLVTGPQLHRLHHSKLKQHLDRVSQGDFCKKATKLRDFGMG